jgi:hypothetical protein
MRDDLEPYPEYKDSGLPWLMLWRMLVRHFG